MSGKIEFYTNPMSRGQIVRWALHEAAAEYTQHIIEYDEMKSDRYLAINPMGKVPAIVHNGKTVTECAGICAYLADMFPDADLLPRTDEKADYYRWMFYAAGPVEAAITNKAMGFEIPDDKNRMAGYGNYEHMVRVLNDMTGSRDYVCGDRFTMADVYLGSHIIWGTQFGSLPQRDNFTAYAARLTERPAYKTAKAIDMDMIPPQQ